MSVSQSENINDMHFDGLEQKKPSEDPVNFIFKKEYRGQENWGSSRYKLHEILNHQPLMVFAELIKMLCRPKCLNRRKYQNLKTTHEYLLDKYSSIMNKHTTLMLSKINVTFCCNTSCQGYITADMIMVFSHLKEPIKRKKRDALI